MADIREDGHKLTVNLVNSGTAIMKMIVDDDRTAVVRMEIPSNADLVHEDFQELNGAYQELRDIATLNGYSLA